MPMMTLASQAVYPVALHLRQAAGDRCTRTSIALADGQDMIIAISPSWVARGKDSAHVCVPPGDVGLRGCRPASHPSDVIQSENG
jgi:hypothetical protein